MSVVSINQLRYEKYASAVGMIDLRNDTTYITKSNNNFSKSFTKEYIKAYMKLLSK